MAHRSRRSRGRQPSPHFRAVAGALVGYLRRHEYGTTDVLHRLCPLPRGVNRSLYGNVCSALSQAGAIRRVGMEQTERKVAHRRGLVLWAIGELSVARRWISARGAADSASTPRQRTLFDAGGEPC